MLKQSKPERKGRRISIEKVDEDFGTLSVVIELF